ncbi:hypothetical protein BCV70DRAFT_209186 [Testicularia cyperi]|uniref:Uncharacterized protein n=1 Tax=Testicularia cyperi TaxID=1882483 RepID=A0A317XWE2_9BASI|nr:hypothetical protein BCV70DRAFT_209186 [Testicularia cyperi]
MANTQDTSAESAKTKPTSTASNRGSGFYNAATFVERALSFRNKPSASSQPGQTSHHDVASTARVNLSPIAALTTRDLQDAGGFPNIKEEQLAKFLPGNDFEEARQHLRAAIEEMHLNYDLDPKLLGERSEVNRALILSKLIVHSEDINREEAHAGQLSGTVADEEDVENAAGSMRDQGSSPTPAKPMVVPRRNFETHDLLKAIDKRDMETIMAIRDANFDLLLDLSQGGTTTKTSSAASQAGGTTNTPLGYAISLGKGWEGISIVLIGALSKFVNTLPDDDDEYEISAPGAAAPGTVSNNKTKKPKKLQLDPRTMQRLRKIRVNLKLAIDHSLFQEQNNLLASYLQVLVMSEGSPFLLNAVETIQHCLTSKLGDPVTQARSQVLQFVTDSLKHKHDRIAAVKDYISNAQGDLLLMALWNTVRLPKSALEQQTDPSSEVQDLANPLPLYFFARDDRVTSHFIERVERVARFDVPSRKHPALLKLATKTAQALQQGTRRKTSNERLDIISAQIQQR